MCVGFLLRISLKKAAFPQCNAAFLRKKPGIGGWGDEERQAFRMPSKLSAFEPGEIVFG